MQQLDDGHTRSGGQLISRYDRHKDQRAEDGANHPDRDQAGVEAEAAAHPRRQHALPHRAELLGEHGVEGGAHAVEAARRLVARAQLEGRVHVDADSEELKVVDPQCLESIENMVLLNDLNNASLLHNLRIRFKANNIYTNVGAILVAVNPFQLLPIYTPEWLDKYKQKHGC